MQNCQSICLKKEQVLSLIANLLPKPTKRRRRMMMHALLHAYVLNQVTAQPKPPCQFIEMMFDSSSSK